MTQQFAINAALLLFIVVIFLFGLQRISARFAHVIERQRMSFLQSLSEMQRRTNGPDTGAAIPSAKPPTGPTKPTTNPRNVRRPTSLG